MKKNLFNIILFSVLAFNFLSCHKEKANSDEIIQNSQTENIKKIPINLKESKIEWKGFKIFKSEHTSHLGILTFKNGELHTLSDGVFVGGILTADVQSIENLDITSKEEKSKLENHLKSNDFFEAEKYPTAKFEIENVISTEDSDYNTILEGKLTIKNITKPFKIRANVVYNEPNFSIFTEPTDIDRTDFGINFQSPIENGILKNEIQIQAIIKSDIQ